MFVLYMVVECFAEGVCVHDVSLVCDLVGYDVGKSIVCINGVVFGYCVYLYIVVVGYSVCLVVVLFGFDVCLVIVGFGYGA